MAFTPFNPETDDPLTLVEAILQEGSNLTIIEDSISYTGGFISEDEVFSGNSGDAPQTAFYDGSLDLNIGSGILLTSGDATPPLENTESGYSVTQEGNADSDLQAVADSAFENSGPVQDANLLEFSFTISDPNVTSVSFDLVFGSEEFPEFSDSSFVDVAAVFVNGDNAALFNNEENQPLSVISQNLSFGNFIANEVDDIQLPADFGGETRALPIEYDGVSGALTIFAPVVQGENTVKIGVGDTGDTILDSGLFVSNFTTRSIGNGGDDDDGGGSGVLIEIPGTSEDDDIAGTDNNEFIETFEGNDLVDPGGGNDVVDLGAGNDTFIGGNGDNNADGGEGEDTAVYSGPFAEEQIEIVDENTIRVGDNTDTLNNFEFLQFDDQTVEIASLGEEPEPEPTPEGVERFAQADDELVEGSTGNDILEAIGFTGNTLEGFAGNDELIAGTNGTLNGGDGNDILEATPGGGGNVLNGDAGDDDLFGGSVLDNPDTLNGGDGNDRLFAGLTANILTGGAGSDQFWIAQAELPQSSIFITDFTQGTDAIGIAGLTGIAETFDDLEIEQTDNTIISVTDGGESITLAVLEDFTGTLTANDFAFDGVVPEAPQGEPVNIAVEPTTGNELDETVFTITATVSEAVTGDQTVDLILAGEASEDDFAEDFPATITIVDGNTAGSVQITIQDDGLVESQETAIFSLENPSQDLAIGENSQAPVVISDTNLVIPKRTTIENLFDEAFYLNNNSDVAAAVEEGDFDTGLEHFLEFGLAEERDPSAILTFFTEESYLENNSDVDAAVEAGDFINGLEHFLIYGVNEDRLGDGYDFFDAETYLSEPTNQDIATAVEIGELDTALEHYLRFGFEENRPGVDLPEDQLDGLIV